MLSNETIRSGLFVQSISPNSCGTAGGCEVTVIGDKFRQGVQVLIDAIECRNSSYLFVPSKIKCFVPPSQKNGLVNIMVKYGTHSAMLNNSFRYNDTLVITDVQPRENLNVIAPEKSSVGVTIGLIVGIIAILAVLGSIIGLLIYKRKIPTNCMKKSEPKTNFNQLHLPQPVKPIPSLPNFTPPQPSDFSGVDDDGYLKPTAPIDPNSVYYEVNDYSSSNHYLIPTTQDFVYLDNI